MEEVGINPHIHEDVIRGPRERRSNYEMRLEDSAKMKNVCALFDWSTGTVIVSEEAGEASLIHEIFHRSHYLSYNYPTSEMRDDIKGKWRENKDIIENLPDIPYTDFTEEFLDLMYPNFRKASKVFETDEGKKLVNEVMSQVEKYEEIVEDNPEIPEKLKQVWKATQDFSSTLHYEIPDFIQEKSPSISVELDEPELYGKLYENFYDYINDKELRHEEVPRNLVEEFVYFLEGRNLNKIKELNEKSIELREEIPEDLREKFDIYHEKVLKTGEKLEDLIDQIPDSGVKDRGHEIELSDEFYSLTEAFANYYLFPVHRDHYELLGMGRGEAAEREKQFLRNMYGENSIVMQAVEGIERIHKYIEEHGDFEENEIYKITMPMAKYIRTTAELKELSQDEEEMGKLLEYARSAGDLTKSFKKYWGESRASEFMSDGV